MSPNKSCYSFVFKSKIFSWLQIFIEKVEWRVNFNDFHANHLQEEVKEKAAIEDAKKEEATPEEDPKGIPEFWLTIFKSVDMLSDMLQVQFIFFM